MRFTAEPADRQRSRKRFTAEFAEIAEKKTESGIECEYIQCGQKAIESKEWNA
jgi:hypothetical protein